MNDRNIIVVSLCGLPGSGKTTLSETIAGEIASALILSREKIIERLEGNDVFDSKRIIAFDLLKEKLGEAISCGKHSVIIIDGMSFSRTGELEEIEETSSAHDACAYSFFLSCSPLVAASRVEKDIKSGDYRKLRNEQLVHSIHQRMRSFPSRTIILDAEQPKHLVTQSALDFLSGIQ
jgi:shikimate kinase